MPARLLAAQGVGVLLALALGHEPHAAGQSLSPTFTTIYNFSGCSGTSRCDGTAPSSLVIGSGGVLYGTTFSGGTYGCGTVFSLTPTAPTGGAWTEAVLYDFACGEDGWAPAGLVAGSGGVLYGATLYGGDASSCIYGYDGPFGCGALLSLTPPAAPGGGWTEAPLFAFTAVTPDANIVIGDGGVLYGATAPGPCVPLFGSTCWSSSGPGYVYSLTPPAAPGAAWTQAVLDGSQVTGGYSNVVIGSGRLPYVAIYTTSNPPSGQVLSLSPPAGGANHAWTNTAIYTFAGSGPNWLKAGLGGVLYGIAAGGGGSVAQVDSVWSLAPPTAPGGPWTESTLYTFSAGTNINLLTAGSSETLYGASYATPCGNTHCGALFSLVPSATPGGLWAGTALYGFTGGADGTGPAALVVGGDGFLYGTTLGGGSAGLGSVFMLKMAVPEPVINSGGLVTAASYTAPVAPGSIASVFGDFFMPAPLSATGSPLPASLAGLSLQFDTGAPAPLFFVSGGQVNLQVPWELAGQPQASLAATLNGQTGAAQTVNLAAFAPAIFATNAQGSGQGAILDESNHLVDASNPATPGSTVLQIFCTGLGPVTIQPQTGSPAPLNALSYTSTAPTVTIGGVPAGVSFSGLAPGFVGLYQVNAQVPPGLAANSAMPVVISMPGATSNTVTIAVQ